MKENRRMNRNEDMMRVEIRNEKNRVNRMKEEEKCKGEMELNREGSERVMKRMRRKRRRG